MLRRGTKVVEIPLQSDGEGLCLHFTGGVLAAKSNSDAWQISPIFIDKRPSIVGFLTKSQLELVTNQTCLQPIAFQRFGWSNGKYHSSWTPLIPGKSNHLEVPANLWSNISGNMTRSRIKNCFKASPKLSESKVVEILDASERVEALARYISLSLRNMDISVKQISDYYNEQLISHMWSGQINGENFTDTSAQTLYAHVHSFFLHLGSSRDYLAALISQRIGLKPKKSGQKKIDSMARLVENLQSTELPVDALLQLLFDLGYIDKSCGESTNFENAGWMKQMTKIRNEFVHERPYGSKIVEKFGKIVPVQAEDGIYRYYRAIHLKEGPEQDVLDVIHHHYSKCVDLFYKAATASQYDMTMFHFTDEDITPD